MILAGKSTLKIHVDPDRFRTESLRRSGLDYLLDRLFSGREVAAEEFESWGLVVEEMSSAAD